MTHCTPDVLPQFAVVGFAILGYLALRVHSDHAPVPGRVVDEAGRLLATRDEILQAVGVPHARPDAVRLGLRPRRLPGAGLHRRLPAPPGRGAGGPELSHLTSAVLGGQVKSDAMAHGIQSGFRFLSLGVGGSGLLVTGDRPAGHKWRRKARPVELTPPTARAFGWRPRSEGGAGQARPERLACPR